MSVTLLQLVLPMVTVAAPAPAGTGSAKVTTLGSKKCDRPGHEHLCEHLKQYTAKGVMKWNGTNDEARAFRDLYNSYHMDRGNITELFAGKTLLDLVSAHPPATFPRTLEGGTGTCVLLREMKKRGYMVAGHEISSVAIGKYCTDLPVTNGLLQRMPYMDATFDMIYSVDCLEHVPPGDIPKTFQELRRVAKAGAPFFFNLGHCAKLAGGVAHSTIIHASGLCDTYPRSWWNMKLRAAGFEAYSEPDQRAYEARAKLSQARIADSSEANKALAHKDKMGNWRYNDRAHTWFMYRAV